MKKTIAVLLLIFTLTVFIGCAEQKVSYMEGTFLEKSDTLGEEYGVEAGYGVINLTIKGNRFTICEYTLCDINGGVKDNYYVYSLPVSQQKKALAVIEAGRTYCDKFIEHQGFKGWDPDPEAKATYEQFKRTMEKLLKRLEKTEE